MQLQLLLVVGVLGAVSCNDKIVGGNDADPAKYPWLISLFYEGYNPDGNGLFCSGALVSPSFILSAASCFYPSAIDGEYDLDLTTAVAGLANLDGEGQQTRTTVDVIYHPNYNNDTWQYDFALFKVDPPFEINENVNVTILAETDGDLDKKRCYVAGFGIIKEGTGRYADELQEVKTTVRSRSKCRAAADKENKPDEYFGTGAAIKGHMMCTKNKKKGPCAGDYGGPLTCWDKGTDIPVTVGVYSDVLAGMSCKRGWNVYMRTQFVVDWIMETTAADPVLGWYAG